MADLSNQKIKDSYQFLLQADSYGDIQNLRGETPNPLTINGFLKYVDGNQQDGYVLTSDGLGNVSWGQVSLSGDLYISAATMQDTILKLYTTSGTTISVPVSYWSNDGNGNFSNSGLTGNVGIGTSTPNEKLTVVGAISATTDLTVVGNVDIEGNTTTGGDLTISGDTITSGNLIVSGSTSTFGVQSLGSIIIENDKGLAFRGIPGGGGVGGITYEDSSGVNRGTFSFTSGDVVVLQNRAANGNVEIRANNTAGSGGEFTVAEFKYDLLTLNTSANFNNESSYFVISGKTALREGIDFNDITDTAERIYDPFDDSYEPLGYFLRGSYNTTQTESTSFMCGVAVFKPNKTYITSQPAAIKGGGGQSTEMAFGTYNVDSQKLVEVLTLTSEGNVGIKNPNPLAALSVSGSISGNTDLTIGGTIRGLDVLSVSGSISGNTDLTIGGTITGGGNLTTGGHIIIPNDGKIGSDSTPNSISINASGMVNFTQAPVFSDNLFVSGTTHLRNDVTIADGNLYMAGGKLISFDNSLDGTDQWISGNDNNITIDGDDYVKVVIDTEFWVGTDTNTPKFIVSADGNVTSSGSTRIADNLFVSGDTYLGNNIYLPDNGQAIFGAGGDLSITHNSIKSIITNTTGELLFENEATDANIRFKGDDDGSTITALTLDMSDAGTAQFNAGATFAGEVAMGINKITGLGTPTLDADATTKNYVDEKYAYQYITFLGNVGTLANADWAFPGTNGVYNHTWAGTVGGVSGITTGSTTMSINRTIQHSFIRVPAGTILHGVEGSVRANSDNPVYAGLFTFLPDYEGPNAVDATLRTLAKTPASDNNVTNDPQSFKSVGLAAGSVMHTFAEGECIIPALRRGSTSNQAILGNFTIILKTLVTD